jgi:hypothetical protein
MGAEKVKRGMEWDSIESGIMKIALRSAGFSEVIVIYISVGRIYSPKFSAGALLFQVLGRICIVSRCY